jgi:hypothetical protein
VPVDTLDLVGEHGAGDGQARRQDDLERIALDAARDRADDGLGRHLMIGARRKHDGRSSAGLLASGLGSERKRDEAAAVRCRHVR